jgi:hypothetical protein
MMGESVGSCNSREKKYRWRVSERVCPSCGAAAIIQTKHKTGPETGAAKNFWCAPFKGGCGTGFKLEDPAITQQEVGRVANPDIADQVNTIQKMAQKRALIAAVLIVTNCSDAFTQDLSDTAEELQQETLARRLKEEEQKQAETDPPELTAFLAKFDGKPSTPKGPGNDEMLVADVYEAVKQKHGEAAAAKLYQMFGNPDKDAQLWRRIARQMWLTLNQKTEAK